MQFLTLEQILILQQRVIERSGGATGIRDKNILESAVAQPYMSYDGHDLYPTLIEKVSALGFHSLTTTFFWMVISALVMQLLKSLY